MATKKTETTVEIPPQFTESANTYLERLQASHERMTSAVETVRARNARIADKFLEAMFAGQRDALALSRSLVTEPTAYAKNMEAMMQSVSVAQERALDVAKTVYREQTDAAAEMRTAAEQTVASVKAWAPAMDKLSAMWTPPAK